MGRTSPHQQGACHSAWGACLLCSREEEVWLSPRRLEQASPALSEAQQANLWQSQGTFSKTHFQNFSPCPSSQSALIHTPTPQQCFSSQQPRRAQSCSPVEKSTALQKTSCPVMCPTVCCQLLCCHGGHLGHIPMASHPRAESQGLQHMHATWMCAQHCASGLDACPALCIQKG